MQTKETSSSPYGSLLSPQHDNLEAQEYHTAGVESTENPAKSSMDFFVWLLVYLVLSSLGAGFGNSLEPVTILTFISYASVVQYFHHLYRNESCLDLRNKAWYWVIFWVFQALGFCLGFSSIFGDGALNVFITFCAGLLLWLLILVLVIIPYLQFEFFFPQNRWGVVVFAVLQTTIACSLVGNLLSTFVVPGNAVLDYLPLRQVAFFLGIYGVNFTAILMAIFIPYLMKKAPTIGVQQCLTIAQYFAGSLIVAFVVTGFLIQSQYLYQINGLDLVRPSIQVSCVNAQSIEYQTQDWYTLWNQTQSRILQGDAIVLMTEEAMLLKNDAQVTAAMDLAQSIAQQTTLAKGALVGFTYVLFEPGASMGTNRFVLISSENGGTLLWNYAKSHPVPIVEYNITAGSPVLPTASSAYGKLGGAICFDLDFPQFIAQAGRAQVDLLLQPSWTWNAILTRHFEGDAVRAIENGFTLFRCSSDGESGIVDPYGKFLARQITGTDPLQPSVFILPLRSHVSTFFTYLGFVFEYLCIAASAVVYLVLCTKAFAGWTWAVLD